MVAIQPLASETPALDTFEEAPFPEEDPSDGPVVLEIEPVDEPEEQAPAEEDSGDEVDGETAVEEDPFATPAGSADLPGRRLLRAGDPATAATELARLSTDPDSDVRMAVARNPATPPELLITLTADDEHPGVRWWAAAHPANWPETRRFPPPVDPDEIEDEEEEEVAEGEAIEVDDRTYVGVNPGPWRYVLAALAADNAARAWAAANPHTPPDALLALAGDLDPDVAVWVATNPNAPLLALEYLAESEDPLACRAVAANPGAPPHLLALIAARSLAGRLVTDRVPIGCDVPGALVGVARNPNTWPETLAILAGDGASGVRTVVAGNPSTPPPALEALATDEEIVVRAAVAANLLTPHEVLGRLLTDGEPLVRWTAATNPATPLELLEGFAEGTGELGERVAPIEPLPEVDAWTPAAGEAEPEETAPESDTADQSDTEDENDTEDEGDTEDDGDTGDENDTEDENEAATS